MYIDALISSMVIFSLILCFTTVPEILVRRQDLDYMAKSLVRVVETYGCIDGRFYAALSELEGETGMKAEVRWDGNFTYRSGAYRIQLRERFSLELSYVHEVRVITPLFAEGPAIRMEMVRKVSGVGCYFWKD